MSARTEAEANRIDLELFRLIDAIEKMSDGKSRRRRAELYAAAEHLREARPIIRSFMSEKDRAET